MKNIYLLVLLLPLFSYGQQFKSSVSWLFHHSNDTKQLVDSCVYNENGMLIFRRDYNLFKENDYEDKRYTYNGAGKLVKSVSYDVAGQPWLTDSIGYDEQNRVIFEKAYRNNNGEVITDKEIRYGKNSVDIGKDIYVLRTYDTKGQLATEEMYKDTVLIEKTEYQDHGKKVTRGELIVQTSDEGEFTYKNGILISQIKGAEKVFFGVPVKREVTIFDENGLKKMVQYYQDGKYYQHLEYYYRR
ncbi:hypothetical protein SAMN05428988_1601 [Chitinophaga sp. YR573]|uniref:hypothetical protein n=1 Tax=Chitinophaga sp. YR573 TaxID=1881040 RepID=UPI0008CFD0BB|nr:hypothetical protein [Chitinophaga sp. YR573]SEW05187.1 hypothetical protein SAMN05428988_1601 [Chitinophaga sp. YR573]